MPVKKTSAASSLFSSKEGARPKKLLLASSLFLSNEGARPWVIEEPGVLLQPDDPRDEPIDALTHYEMRAGLVSLRLLLKEEKDD